jgi:hypothetical protein
MKSVSGVGLLSGWIKGRAERREEKDEARRRAEAAAEAERVRKAGEAKRRADAAAEADAVRKAVEAFGRMLQSACAEVAVGRVPSAEALDKARKELLKVVTASALGPHLPLLQRFLRAGAVELVAAAAAVGANSQMLKDLFQRQAEVFEEAREETRRVLDADPGRFWEETV